MADSSLFSINLVTPERILLTGHATEVILRTGEGDITFLAGHTPLVGTIEPCVVRVVRAEGDEDRVAVHGGFVQVEQGVHDDEDSGAAVPSPTTAGTRVTLLVGVAELAVEIDTDRARAALDAAEARLSDLNAGGGRSTTPSEGDDSDPEVVEAEAALLRAQVRLETVDATSSTTA